MANWCGWSHPRSSAKQSNALETSTCARVCGFPRPRVTLFAAKELFMTESNATSRRKFISQAAATAATLTIVPRHVLGRGFVPPSDTLNIAGIGVGGMGRANLINLSSQNIVALCDVDWGYAGKSLDRLDSDIPTLQKRLAEPPSTTPQQSPTPGQP